MQTVYLTGVINEETDRQKNLYGRDLPMGMLVQPLTDHYLDRAYLYNWIGIDNGCFSEIGRKKFILKDYLRMIERAMEKAGPDYMLFATAPDEPFDWDATLRKSIPVLSKITALGTDYYNIASICLQDGATPETVPWDLIGSVFIGGSTEWKLGSMAHAIVREAQRRHKHVHMGRVNSLKRMLLCQKWGVDTADGTYLLYTHPVDGAWDIIEWLREQWRFYECHHCGIRNPFCICGGKVEQLSREEIDARYAIPVHLNHSQAKAFVRQYAVELNKKRQQTGWHIL